MVVKQYQLPLEHLRQKKEFKRSRNALKEYTGANINENGEDKESIFFKLPPLLR